jgi:hypothetical protein
MHSWIILGPFPCPLSLRRLTNDSDVSVNSAPEEEATFRALMGKMG